jgi:hypothetical protein
MGSANSVNVVHGNAGNAGNDQILNKEGVYEIPSNRKRAEISRKQALEARLKEIHEIIDKAAKDGIHSHTFKPFAKDVRLALIAEGYKVTSTNSCGGGFHVVSWDNI